LGRGWRAKRAGRGATGACCIHYLLEHRFRSPEDIGIPESKHTESFFLQPKGPNVITSQLGVLTSVYFKNQLPVERSEIDNIRPDWHLPLEFTSTQSMRT
jgi:hypothetical protein